jgi:glycerol-3-phosphate cytidylyltransferase
MTKNVITYGTFDLFHVGHLRLLHRLRALGDRLIVAVSTDEFNRTKSKRSLIPYEQRAEIVANLRIVDEVIPEESWDQKVDDIKRHDIHVFGIGDDWAGKFDFLKPHCEVVYLPRTHGISSTALRDLAHAVDQDMINRLRDLHMALDVIVRSFD